jgi:hypothetical protein
MVAEALVVEGYAVAIEQAMDDGAPYRTTIAGSARNKPVKLIEAQHDPASSVLEPLATYLAARRAYCELYVAVHDDIPISGAFLNRLERHGIGLMIVGDGPTLVIRLPAANPALTVTRHPGLSLGALRSEVDEAIQKFNRGDRKDGVRDLSEIAERETDRLIRKAARRGALAKSEAEVAGMNWENQIDVLASARTFHNGVALFDSSMKQDMSSFRAARNLFDHKVTSKKAAISRDIQSAERMMTGARLIAEIKRLYGTL